MTLNNARRMAEHRFVEDELGVQRLMLDVDVQIKAIDIQNDRVKSTAQLHRLAKTKLEHFELDLLAKIAADNAGISVAAQERAYKLALAESVEARDLQDNVTMTAEKLNEAEADLKLAYSEHRSSVTKLAASGSILEFLAAYKNGRNLANATDLPRMLG